MKTFLIVILSVFFNLSVFGTGQIPDKIIYKGKEYMLYPIPMGIYFEKYPERRPKSEEESTDLWRGYVATFEITKNKLYLKDIRVLDNGGWKSVRKEVFPRKRTVKVDWMTGLLEMPSGKLINYVHMGFSSSYEHYTILEMKKGKLVKEKQFTLEEYEEFKEKQYQAFKKTDEYKKNKADLQKEYFNYNWSDETIDHILKIRVMEFSSKILVE